MNRDIPHSTTDYGLRVRLWPCLDTVLATLLSASSRKWEEGLALKLGGVPCGISSWPMGSGEARLLALLRVSMPGVRGPFMVAARGSRRGRIRGCNGVPEAWRLRKKASVE